MEMKSINTVNSMRRLTSFHLSKDAHRDLKIRAAELGITMADALREAVELWLIRDENEKLENISSGRRGSQSNERDG